MVNAYLCVCFEVSIEKRSKKTIKSSEKKNHC